MPLLGSDIMLVHSGGTNNANPANDLGGDPSVHPLSASLNNLFDDITGEQSKDGRTDYRCFYIFNNSDTDDFKNVNIWVNSEVTDGASISIGIPLINDVQVVTVTGSPVVSGTMTLAYDATNFVVNYDTDLTVWAANFQSSIRAVLPILSTVAVTVSSFPNTVNFSVTFNGDAGLRSQPLLEVIANNLGGSAQISIAKSIVGSPINLIADSIDVATTPPTGIAFSLPTQSNPISLGNLRATEGLPVWIQRVTPSNASALANDGFSLKIRGQAIP